MKILQINAVCGKGSTGKICASISELLNEKGIENYILYSAGKSNHNGAIKYSNEKYIKVQALKSRVFGNYGFNSVYCTRKLLKYMDRISPDVVHLHNLHGHNCHLGMLFKYLKKHNIKVYWTFHDCFAFTGYCMYFDCVECDKWMTACKKCPQYKKYSWLFDRSNYLYNKKKRLYSNMDITVITPSQWLADLVKKSFLNHCKTIVVNNGIDLNVFKPYNSSLREKYHIHSKYIVLGVSFGWEYRKGLDVFIKLSQTLTSDYQIVLVGTNQSIDENLPNNIISIHKTDNQIQLAEIYSVADVFVNPTREENFPTVNMEALACGAPVVTFDTGGSAEIIDDNCGIAVPKDDYKALVSAIKSVCNDGMISRNDCIKRARFFSAEDKYTELIKHYGV